MFLVYNLVGEFMRQRNVKNKLEIINNSKYFVNNPSLYKGKWNSFFNNSNPIYIEIGMGKGKFIIENALRNPSINYIGIEKFDSILALALKKVPDINNLVMIRLDAKDIDLVFDKEVDKIYLNFSDPWPKKRHEKRRLMSKNKKNEKKENEQIKKLKEELKKLENNGGEEGIKSVEEIMKQNPELKDILNKL